jgi:hypothetical protein
MKLMLKRNRQMRRTEIAGTFSGAILGPKIESIELSLAKTSFIFAIGLPHVSRPGLEYFFVQLGKECHRKFQDDTLECTELRQHVRCMTSTIAAYNLIHDHWLCSGLAVGSRRLGVQPRFGLRLLS